MSDRQRIEAGSRDSGVRFWSLRRVSLFWFLWLGFPCSFSLILYVLYSVPFVVVASATVASILLFYFLVFRFLSPVASILSLLLVLLIASVSSLPLLLFFCCLCFFSSASSVSFLPFLPLLPFRSFWPVLLFLAVYFRFSIWSLSLKIMPSPMTWRTQESG